MRIRRRRVKQCSTDRSTIETLLLNLVGKLPQHGLSSQISLSGFFIFLGGWGGFLGCGTVKFVIPGSDARARVNMCARVRACFGEQKKKKKKKKGKKGKQHQDLFSAEQDHIKSVLLGDLI